MRVKLEEVCSRGSSNLMKKEVASMDGKYPIYGASGQIGTANFYHQEKPYVAVVKDGAGIGRTMLLPAYSSVIGTLQYLIPKHNVLPDYLCYVVQYMNLAKYSSGATIPHIYFRDYKNEEFNLASVDRQQEIVTTLNKIQRIITRRRTQLSKLDELIKCRFVEMFGDSQCSYSQIQSIAEDVFAGGDKPKDTIKTKDTSHPYPVFANGELNQGLQGYSRLCRVDKKAITVSARGTIGYCCIRDAGFTPIVRLITLIPKPNINLTYLSEAIKFIGVGASGAVQAQLTVPDFKKIKIPLPSINSQITFASFVRRIDKFKFAYFLFTLITVLQKNYYILLEFFQSVFLF